MKKLNLTTHKKGLSVIEIILSLIIITVAVTVVFNMFLLSDSINEKTRRLDAAVFSANKVLSKAVPESDESLIPISDTSWSLEEEKVKAVLTKEGSLYSMVFYNEKDEVIYEIKTSK